MKVGSIFILILVRKNKNNSVTKYSATLLASPQARELSTNNTCIVEVNMNNVRDSCDCNWLQCMYNYLQWFRNGCLSQHSSGMSIMQWSWKVDLIAINHGINGGVSEMGEEIMKFKFQSIWRMVLLYFNTHNRMFYLIIWWKHLVKTGTHYYREVIDKPLWKYRIAITRKLSGYYREARYRTCLMSLTWI